jgi:tRNA (cmo5U34)-methyltransferase
MLDHCRSNVEEAGLEDRVEYAQGRVEDFGSVPLFDAATSVFVAHFIRGVAGRKEFFQTVANLLRPGAPFVLADLYTSSADGDTELLMEAWRTHYVRAGASASDAEQAFAKIRRDIYFATEPELEQALTQVGFAPLLRFYQSFLWGGWSTHRRGTPPEAAG